MKNSLFPSPALLKNQFKSSRKLRIALVLTLIAVVSSLPFYSLAQGDPIPVKKARTYSIAPGKGTYILYAGPKGETLCREATTEEALRMRDASSSGLIQINHLKNEERTETTNAGLTIILRATAQLDANPTAKNAFIAAAAKWEALIQDPITIAIDVDFGTTFFGDPFSGPNVIGATESPQFFFPNNYPDVRSRLISHAPVGSAERDVANALPAGSVPTDIGSVDTVVVTSPHLRALGAMPADYNNDNPVRTAPRVGFNSAFGFDFNPNDGPPPISGGLTDFDAVAVHEIGHVLGFNSEVGSRELDPTSTLAVTIWDLFRFRPGTANLGNFGTAQRILSSGGTQVQFSGGAELGLSTGKPDGTGGDGEQAAHWKADELSGTFLGIMDPTIPRGVREVMSSNDQNTIDSFGYTTTPTAPPPNDNFVNAQVLTGNSGTVNGTNRFATKETGEPIHSPDDFPSGKSIWYRWTAPNSGTVTMTTAGSDFDTLLAVYTGSAVNALTLPGANFRNDDENNPGGILTSRVQFSAVGGTVYQIAVDGYGGDQGSVTFNWSLPGGTPTPTPTPTPGVVQFSSSTASVTEAPNTTVKVDLLVTRTGTTSAAASVKYATSNATAIDRSDYEAAAGTLQFAAGETQKTITVFIVDDSYNENAETFNVTLSSPVGCTIGSIPAVAVTITSNDGVGAPNPFNEPEFFVRQHYLDFFNRAPDDSGLAFWKGEITSCGTNAACIEVKRINVSAAFYLSIEFQETGFLVYRMYKAGYGNLDNGAAPVPVRLADFLPDTQQIGNGVVIGSLDWQTKLNNNKIAFAQDFVTRAAFVAKHPTNLSPTAFVNALFANGGVTPTGAELAAAVAEFSGAGNTADTAARARALRLVAENPTLTNQEFRKAFVLMQYFGYLRRNPYDPPELSLDYGGYNVWLGKLNQFNGNLVEAEMVKAFITSGEYRLRFGP